LTVGAQIGVSNGTWINSPDSYAYQWLRNGANIALNGTSQFYTLVVADAGAMISCRVTATNADGSVPATSAARGPVLQMPANTVAPVLSGVVQTGQTLSTTNGTWTGSPAPAFTYEWFRDGVEILGAIDPTYVLGFADVGHNIRVSVIGTNGAGSVAAQSNQLGPVTLTPIDTAAQYKVFLATRSFPSPPVALPK
jgi:hypothetical protein